MKEVVVVKPEEYPEVKTVEDISVSFPDKTVRIGGCLIDMVVLAEEQKEGVPLNRAVYETDGSQIRQIIAGDFVICGIERDGSLRGLRREEVRICLERFRQPEKFITAGNVVFAVPYHRIWR